ncbi:MAG: divergent PAP2 family protein [Candidatus Gastranaerophilales bacterium]|nr:divergent PAP2 family protein [Candidatus Gastranaerophilales bacterium]
MENIEFFNTGYEALFCGLLSAFIAQFIKVITYIFTHKKINFKIFTTTGGMPSSHTAGVIALSVSVALIEGFDSIAFAISLGFSLIVMQDASGVRRAAGKTAATLNRLVDEFVQKNKEVKPYEALKELLGHTPLEVFCGMILGIIVPLVVHYYDFFIN